MKMLSELLKPIWKLIGKTPDTGAFGSPIEEMLYDACFNAGLVNIRLQYPVGPYRTDLAIPAVRLAIEADGAAYHNKANDDKRDAYFASQGWTVIRFTGSQIYRDAESCAERVKELFEYKQARIII